MVSPRGMLGREALRFSRYRKLAFWHALQRSALQSATCFHATSKKEYNDVRMAGLRQPVAIIPNEIDLPTRRQNVKGSRQPKNSVVSRPNSPKKGRSHALEAWSNLENKFPDWHLKIVGPLANNDHAKDLQQIIGVKESCARAAFRSTLWCE